MAEGNAGENVNGLPISVGARLREIRQEKRLSLREVARQLGISASLLSQVENGKTQPSVGTLYGLVTFYGASMDTILTGRDAGPAASRPAPAAPRTETAVFHTGPAVQRSAENPTLEMENGVTWERLAVATNDRAVQPLLVTYAPGASSSLHGRFTQHLGVEYAYVIAGTLTLHLEFEVLEVPPGDSIAFSSSRPHYYSNHGDVPAQAVFFVDGRGDTVESDPAGGVGEEDVAGILARIGLDNGQGGDGQGGAGPGAA
ncbi:MAG: helix-turn-helix domain-containing protein [Nocardioidaceae bacterium]|nr:helix-turn-helix domain-containing protein [Nocardioidaceae bacterium]